MLPITSFFFRIISVRVFSFFLLVFGFSTANGQNTKTLFRHQIGLDLGRMIYFNALPRSKGFNVEVPCRFRLDSNLVLVSSVGYSYFSRKEAYKNTDFTTKGLFGSAGIDFSAYKDEIYFGASVVVSQNQTSGTFKIPGDYFGTFSQKFDKDRFLVAFQVHNLYKIPLSQRVALGVKIYVSYIASGLPRNSVENTSYYSPGIGLHKDNRFTAGINAHLYYNFSSL
jgi:hypothetical protein